MCPASTRNQFSPKRSATLTNARNSTSMMVDTWIMKWINHRSWQRQPTGEGQCPAWSNTSLLPIVVPLFCKFGAALGGFALVPCLSRDVPNMRASWLVLLLLGMCGWKIDRLDNIDNHFYDDDEVMVSFSVVLGRFMLVGRGSGNHNWWLKHDIFDRCWIWVKSKLSLTCVSLACYSRGHSTACLQEILLWTSTSNISNVWKHYD